MTEWMIEINESMKFAKFIFQKCPGTGSFYGLYVKSSSHYSLVHRLPASSSKSAPTLTVFFYIFKCESTSRYRPVHFLSATFADRGRQPRKQRPYTSATTEATLHKKSRVSRPGIFSSLNSRVPDLLHFPTTWWWWWWWCGWHDDDGENAARQSSITRKFSNY